MGLGFLPLEESFGIPINGGNDDPLFLLLGIEKIHITFFDPSQVEDVNEVIICKEDIRIGREGDIDSYGF